MSVKLEGRAQADRQPLHTQPQGCTPKESQAKTNVTGYQLAKSKFDDLTPTVQVFQVQMTRNQQSGCKQPIYWQYKS